MPNLIQQVAADSKCQWRAPVHADSNNRTARQRESNPARQVPCPGDVTMIH